MAVDLLLCIRKKIISGTAAGSALIELDNSFPSYPSSNELNIFVRTQDPKYIPSSREKEKLVEKFAAFFSGHGQVSKIDKTDGIQVFFKNKTSEFSGWILIRKSNNEDKLVVVTSAPTQEDLDIIEKIFFETAINVKAPPITGLVLKEEDRQGEDREADPYIARRIKYLLK